MKSIYTGRFVLFCLFDLILFLYSAYIAFCPSGWEIPAKICPGVGKFMTKICPRVGDIPVLSRAPKWKVPGVGWGGGWGATYK